MDKKLIISLNSLTDSISMLIDSLSEKESKKSSTLDFSGIFNKKSITKIQKDIQSLKDDNKKILKSNDDILKELRKKPTASNPLGAIGKDKKSLKDGIVNITIMAGAILALGMAFKVIGEVDFKSVIALSIALPLIAFAFEKIGSIKKLTYKDVINVGLIIVAAAGAMMVSSWLLYMIAPLNITQLFTIVGLSAAIAISMIGFQSILGDRNFSKIKISDTLKLPIIILGMATSIVLASHILVGINPMSLSDLTNIVVGSLAVSAMALFMSPAFVILSTLLDKVSVGGIIKGSLAIVLMSGAVAVSSYLLSMGDYSAFPSLEFMTAFSIGMAILSVPVAILGMIGLPAIIMGSVGLVFMSGAILASSYLLSKMDTRFLYKLSDAFAYFINVIRVPLTAFMRDMIPIIADGIGLLAKNVFPVITEMATSIIPVITDLVDTLGKHLLPFILGIVEAIGNIISKVSDGIVNIINAITDSVMRLSTLSGSNLIMIGAGLGAIGAGLLLLTGSSFLSGLSDFFGLGIGDTLSDISQYGPLLFMSGKGIDMMASSLERLSKINQADLAAANKGLSNVALASVDQLMKYNGMVISVNSKDLATLIKGDNSNISISPRTDTAEVSKSDSEGKSIGDLYSLIMETNSYLSSIAVSSNETANRIKNIRPQTVTKKPNIK